MKYEDTYKVSIASISLIVNSIMGDLDNYIEQRESKFTPEHYRDIEEWMEWFDEDITSDEYNVTANVVHEALGMMSIWDDAGEHHCRECLNKIEEYFSVKFDRTKAEYFKNLVITVYTSD